MDTLRADHLGCHGHPRETSPHIDAFADEALLFENASAHAPSTWPSVASLMTGYLPHETRAVAGFERGLVADVDSLAEILRDRGYRTLAVVGNWGLVAERGWSQGFDVFDDVMLDRELVRGIPERIAEPTTDRAIQLLDEHADEPFFLWVHYQDPHGPYTPPEPFASRFLGAPSEDPLVLELNDSTSGRGGIPSYQQLGAHRDFAHYRAQYEGEIRYLDHHFGRLVAALRRHGLYDEAFIVFTADHGEAMGEKGLYFGHGESLDRPLLHVPLMIRHGSRLRGRRSDPVQHVDVVPTLLAVAGAEPLRRPRGRDLREEGPARAIVAEKDAFGVPGALDVALTFESHRLVCGHGPSGEVCRLFDLERDPGEERDLAGDPRHRARLDELKARMRRIVAEDRLAIRLEGDPKPASPEEKEALRSLGYLE